MDLTSHKDIQKRCMSRAIYFESIDFPNIAENFRKAAEAMAELIEAIEKLNNLPVEEESVNG